MRLSFLVLLCLTFACAKAQEEDYKLRNPDSLMTVLQKKMSFFEYAEFKKAYDDGNDASKEFLLLTYSLPRGNKAKLIKNLELNKDNIFALEKRFRKLVPAGYRVDIEFCQMYKLMKTTGIVDIKVYKDEGEDTKLIDSGKMLNYNTKRLSRILNLLNWTDDTLREIEGLLRDAGCVGINNIKVREEISELIELNFSQSGLAMYSYLIFPKNLTLQKIKEYNNGCTYIFYKDNIVLEFGSGAVGQYCFEKD